MSAELEVYEAPVASVTLFRTDEPAEVVAHASKTASALADVVNKQKLFVQIQRTKHVRVEGWTLLGSMLGVFPVLDGDPQEVEVAGVRGWRATVKAVTRDGSVVGRASALCLRSETNWRNRDEYALMSMAQTRATSKALRQPLGFVMSLAGFSATPAEEMPREGFDNIEDAEVVEPIVSPDGGVFPDQREDQGQFTAPTTSRGSASGDITQGQRGMLKRLRKKLVETMNQPAEAIDNEIAKAQTKSQAIQLIDRLKKLAGED